MCAKSRRILVAVAIVTMSCIEFSCSSTATAPKAEKGTPAFYWAAAGETFAANDFVKTSENLEAILKSENEYTARAQPWLLIVTSGMIRGYAEVADGLETGVRVKKGDPGGYRKYISSSRSTAGKLSLHGAYFGVAEGELTVLDTASGQFVPVLGSSPGRSPRDRGEITAVVTPPSSSR